MIVNSLQALDDCMLELKGSFDKHHWLYVKIQAGTRTLKQNAWINKAYEMLEKQGDMTSVEYRRLCKFKLGLQILFQDDPESATRWRTMYKWLNYEDKLLTMDIVPVTSLFSPDQGAQYINAMIIEFNDKQLPSKDWRE